MSQVGRVGGGTVVKKEDPSGGSGKLDKAKLKQALLQKRCDSRISDASDRRPAPGRGALVRDEHTRQILKHVRS